MQNSLSILVAVMLGLPRTAASYVAYLVAPLLVIRWTSTRTLITIAVIVAYLAIVLGLNYAVGLNVSPVAWLLELALLLPFLFAVFSLPTVSRFDGRRFIRVLNLIVFAMSLVSLVRMGFPLQLPYIHYLPDVFDGGFGGGGAKIVTVIGFFGLVEALSQNRKMARSGGFGLMVAGLNFVLPNFILGIIAGACGIAIFARKNRSLVLVGAAAAFVITPYILSRAETKNNAFSEYYQYNPKIYAFKLVGDIYLEHPQVALLGSGIGQYGGEAAIWASPISKVFGASRIGNIPYLTSSDIHLKYLAPTMLRFRHNAYAIESSSNKPYSGISVLLVEFGLITTALIIFLLFTGFWKRSGGEFGKACFVFILAINLLDNQVDSPWFGMLMLAASQIVSRELSQRRSAHVTVKQKSDVGPRLGPQSAIARS